MTVGRPPTPSPVPVFPAPIVSEKQANSAKHPGYGISFREATIQMSRSIHRVNPPHSLARLLVALLATLAPAAGAPPRQANADETAVTFRNDVMAVLSKAGCNAGTCHGNATGKGGFKLSLRGDDPAADLNAITRHLSGRRVNLANPRDSLLLQKPTMQAPHGGGRRLASESDQYRMIESWIAAGARPDPPDLPRLQQIAVEPAESVRILPDNTQQLRVIASFSDGSQRDVTHLAVYEASKPTVEVSQDGRVTATRSGEVTIAVRFLNRQTPVRLAFVADRPDFAWDPPPPSNEIDHFIYRRLQELQIHPSALCSDTVFLRRAYLDLLGVLPTAQEARDFVADDAPDKRSRLVDQLLERPEYAEFWALKWSDLLRIEEKTLDRKGVATFHRWILQQMADNTPLDEFARQLITARGSTYASPPANYYRALRDPIARAEATAQVFLGIRLQCAKCHNHPFDRWTQDDYYSWAGLFARVDYKILQNRRRDRNDKHEFDGEQVVFRKDSGEVNDPRSGRPLPPQVLNSDAPLPHARDRLHATADWITKPDNPFFAKVQVNRIWKHMLGRGIVDPIDDFRITNPPVYPDLLDWLTRDFVDHGFDQQHTIRKIMNSTTYQLSFERTDTNRDDETHFASGIVRRLPAEPLLDAAAQFMEYPLTFNGFPPGIRAAQLPGVRAVRFRDQKPTWEDQFLVTFGKPPRLQSCDCERSDAATLQQVFGLTTGRFPIKLLTHSGNKIDRMIEADWSNETIVDELYWSALSRPPTDEERIHLVNYLASNESRRTLIEDACWALMNCKEFLFRR